jgi:translocation protein SEC72
METPETFHQYALKYDAANDALSCSDPSIAEDIEDLNRVHRGFLALENPAQVPPPPANVNPKRTVQITRLKEAGNAAFKQGKIPESLKIYDLAIRMAGDRPPWEPAGLVREELFTLLNNRAAALMAQQEWPAAAGDAEASVELKRLGNIKGWWRRGQCLKEMGRLQEAEDWVRSGLEFERAGPDRANIGELETLAKDIAKALNKS